MDEKGNYKRVKVTTYNYPMLTDVTFGLSLIGLKKQLNRELEAVRDEITVEGILIYTPDNLLLAAAAMMLFFALKSISIVIYSGILYVLDGMLFPVPAAICLNNIGTVIMVSLPYVL